MRLSTTTLITIALSTSLVHTAPTVPDTDLTLRQDDELMEILNGLQSYRTKRDEVYDTLDKREYEIVTDVLKALNNTQLAPKIIKYLATNSTLQPIVIKTIVAVLKSGKLNMTALFNALDESGLVTTVVQDLIADCSLYVSLFRTAESYISGLVDKVQSAINSLKKRELLESSETPSDLKARDSGLEARAIDLDEVVVNLLQSLANSGLATSVVKSIITDSSYIPFATELIKEVLANDALNFGDLVDALKNTSLASDLLKSILNAQTFDTIVTNAFAAYSGDCASSSGSSDDSTTTAAAGSGSGSTSTSSSVDPCKKRRVRRRRRSNYNY